MKTKLTLVSIALFAAALMAHGENYSKQVVTVDAFTYGNQFSREEANSVRSNVIKNLQATKRIVVVDLLNQSAIDKESERRKSEAAMNDDREIADITQMNANYILRGELNTINVEYKEFTGSDGKRHESWSGEMNYTIHLIDPSKGGIANSYSYKVTSFSSSSETDARNDLINNAKKMSQFVEEVFPLKGTILQVADGDSKKVKTVYIDLGSEHGIQKGQKLNVYIVTEIAGEKSEKQLGTLTVQEVLSASRSICKVNTAAAEIAKNLSTNVEMTIKTIARTGLFADVDFHL